MLTMRTLCACPHMFTAGTAALPCSGDMLRGMVERLDADVAKEQVTGLAGMAMQGKWLNRCHAA